MNALALVFDLKGFTVIALALAHIARHVDVGQKVHFHLDQAIPLTRFAASALHVEGETTRAVPPRAGFRYAGKQLAYWCEQAGVCGRVGTRRTTNRALVDVDYLVQVLKTFDAVVSRGLQRGRTIEGSGAERVERVVDQCRLA